MANSITSGRFLLGIKIEGVGDATQTTDDGIYRWVTGRAQLDDAATVDPDSLYKDALLFWPSELGFSVDFRHGLSSSGKQTFRLRGHSDLWAEVMRYSHATTAKLATALTSSSTSMVLDTGGLTGQLHLERECFRLGTESPAKTYAIDGAGDGARAQLGTTATAHGADADDDAECFATVHILSGRVVEFIRVDLDASSAYDETTLWKGVLRRVSAPRPDVIEIEADSVMSLLRGAKLMTEQWRGRVSAVPTQSNFIDETIGALVVAPLPWPPDGAVSAVPTAGHSTDRRMVLEFDNGAAVVPYELSEDGTWARAWASLDEIEVFGDSPQIGMNNLPAIGSEAWEIITAAEQGVANNAVEDEGTLALASNPGICLLQMLLTTTAGGNHATYDLAETNVAGGIPAALVNVAQILGWTHRTFGGITKDTGDMAAFHLGVGGEEEALWDAAGRLLRPYGAALVQGSAGTLEVAAFADAIGWGISNTISESQILAPARPIGQDRRIEDAVDRLQMTYNAWPGRDPDRLNVEDAIKLKRKLPGWTSSMEIDMSGMPNVDDARALAEHLVVRYHQAIPRITIETTRLADFWVGRVVTLSHSLIFGPSATRNVSAGVCLVIGRTEILRGDGHSIRYELDYVGALITKFGYIAPSAVVASYSDPNITTTTNVYTLDAATLPGAPFNKDVPDDTANTDPWEVGDEIQICDEFGTVIVGSESVTIVSVADDTIEIDTGDITTDPAAGDIVRISSYSNCTAGQQALWVYIADADNLLNAADTPFDYVSGEGQE